MRKSELFLFTRSSLTTVLCGRPLNFLTLSYDPNDIDPATCVYISFTIVLQVCTLITIKASKFSDMTPISLGQLDVRFKNFSKPTHDGFCFLIVFVSRTSRFEISPKIFHLVIIFQPTIRIQVDLPKNQKTFLRINPNFTLREVFTKICAETKNNSLLYELRSAKRLDSHLDLDLRLSDAGTVDFALIPCRNGKWTFRIKL